MSDKSKNKWWNANKEKIITFAVIGVCLTGLEFILVCAELKKQDRERQAKAEFARKILQDYEKERAKSTTVNIDSLVNQHVR